MPLKLGRTYTKDSAKRVEYFFDTDESQLKPGPGEQRPVNSEGEPAESVVFYLQPLTGRAQREISDQMMTVTKRGKSQMLAGSAEMIRVLHSVIEVEGLETVQGRKIARLEKVVYDQLPRWVIEALVEDIHKLNGTDNDDDDDDDGGDPLSGE
jgi:hypothetical protein